jgi:catechol 2,3-dioxygenase-like lactoylglutathione lyase family enzyme
MQVKFVSVLVDDQDKALKFYTEKLGFRKQSDIPMGEYRWLTVVSPDGVAGAELVLEPMAFAPAKAFQQALFEAGIPATAFISTDIDAEYRSLMARGVKFRGEPRQMGPVKVTLFEDGCGNLINLAQPS